jgi:two-component system cell cycle response regulator DivK
MALVAGTALLDLCLYPINRKLTVLLPPVHLSSLIRRDEQVASKRDPVLAARLGALGGFRRRGSEMFEAVQQRRGIMQNGVTERCAARKVLIVEDNDLNMMLFIDLLAIHGYHTLQTKDGLDALRIARLHRPDVIVMDIQLPGMSGLEVTKCLKADEELRSIPVVAVTALAMQGDEKKIRRAGCDGYVAKPFSLAGFMQAVECYFPDADHRSHPVIGGRNDAQLFEPKPPKNALICDGIQRPGAPTMTKVSA